MKLNQISTLLAAAAVMTSPLASADAILGIFGTSDKALRVIPNKVYQGLAVGRAVLTAGGGGRPSVLLHDPGHQRADLRGSAS